MTERDTGSPSASPPVPDSVQVIETIADYVEKDPTEVDFTFGDFLDPDALDTLLESASSELVIAFTVDELLVTVATDGTIEVREFQD